MSWNLRAVEKPPDARARTYELVIAFPINNVIEARVVLERWSVGLAASNATTTSP